MEISALYQLFLSCSCVTTDSRNCPENSLFIALKGESFNGNAFAAKALEAGCRYAIIDEATYLPKGDERYVLVNNGLRTLQLLANYHRRQLQTPVIGITGTNGKTTTKELIAAVLMQEKQILYTQGNLNNAIGVPLTLLRLKPEHELAVVEMGASHPGDIQELVEIAEPDFGLITNVGKAHLQGFGSFEGVMRTKGELYDFLRTRKSAVVFLDHDNPYLKTMVKELPTVEYGKGEENSTEKHTADIQKQEGHPTPALVEERDQENGLYVEGHLADHSPYLTFAWRRSCEESYRLVKTKLIGEYNLTNALAAITIGCYFHIPADKINQALTDYTPTNNRSQLMQTARNTLIVDAYNANPTSMMAALGNFSRMETQHKMLILGDMRELGEDSLSEHQKIVEYLQHFGAERVILVGSEFGRTQHTFTCYPDVEATIEALQAEKPEGMTILIKGSNGIHLNRLLDML